MKKRFALSKSNKAYLATVFVLFLILYIVRGNLSAYVVGEMTGRMLALFLFPCLFALVVWRIAGKNNKPGSIAFNIVLSLALLGQLGRFAEKGRLVNELEQIQASFREELADADGAGTDAAYNQYADSVQEKMDELAENAVGEEKIVFEVCSRFAGEAKQVADRWKASFRAVEAPRVLDLSLLVHDSEFEAQRAIVGDYLEQTAAYKEYFDSMVPEFRRQLEDAGATGKNAAASAGGMEGSYNSQRPFFEPLMESHLKYGECIIQLLDLLQGNRNGWEYKDELLISGEALFNEYNDVVEQLQQSEQQINAWSQKLQEAL